MAGSQRSSQRRIKGKGNRKSTRWPGYSKPDMRNDFIRAAAKEEEKTERISKSVTLTGFMVVLFAIFLTQEAKVGLTRNRIGSLAA